MNDINGSRLSRRLTQLGQIGFMPGEGTTRLPYTPAYDEGRTYVQRCMEQAGLQTSIDPVGNLVGELPGKGKTICIGSHIDTVPGGGIYDGTYGVLAGVEAPSGNGLSKSTSHSGGRLHRGGGQCHWRYLWQ